MVFKISGQIKNDIDGFQKIAELEEQTKSLIFGSLVLDFHGVSWFDANLLAALGAVLNQISENLNTIEFKNIPSEIGRILEKNGFLSFYGGGAKPGHEQTTIKFQKFDPNEIKNFKRYLDANLLKMKSLPNMTPSLKKRISESMIEIYNNSAAHGESQAIFSCGQYLPSHKKIDFSIVNLGKTIRSNVEGFIEVSINGPKAIEWAVKKGNTTRLGSIPGGIGLSLLREFLRLNKGKVQIYSGDGYWVQDSDGSVCCQKAKTYFSGTLINLEFNVNDASSYKISSE